MDTSKSRNLWKQAEMSDLKIVIATVRQSDPVNVNSRLSSSFSGAPRDSSHTVLQKFPGHSQILRLCPFFAPQVLQCSRQSQPETPEAQEHGKAGSRDSETAGSGSSSTSKPKQQIVITLPDTSFHPAAIAVLEGLYHNKPWPELMADLIPLQQVQAAVLADTWQLPTASKAAVAALKSTADCADSLSGVMEELLSLKDMPNCLLPVLEHWKALSKYSSLSEVPPSMRPHFEQAMLSKYGDLEAVWAQGGATLQESLMKLPLPAIELLLASDKLKTASEDTVLYTAQAYVDRLTESKRQHAVNKLAPLVRCPHLSQFWLSATVLSDDADKLLLQGRQPQLKRLLLLKQSHGDGLSADMIKKGVPGVHASWLLPVRDIQPASSAKLEWEVDVAAIKRAVQDSASRKKRTELTSPTSCLLGGVMWDMGLNCAWDASKQGSTIRLNARAKKLPVGTVCHGTFSLVCVGVDAISPNRRAACTGIFEADTIGWCSWGYDDFFMLGSMSGGFDEAAWAAKGLPASGSIKLRLTVKDVGV